MKKDFAAVFMALFLLALCGVAASTLLGQKIPSIALLALSMTFSIPVLVSFKRASKRLGWRLEKEAALAAELERQGHLGPARDEKSLWNLLDVWAKSRHVDAQPEQLKETHAMVERLNQLTGLLDQLCFMHLPVEIHEKWKAMLDANWNRTSMDALSTLESIKDINEQDQAFIETIAKEHGAQQEDLARFSEDYSKAIREYAGKAELIRTSFLGTVQSSTERIRETFDSFKKVTEVTERIKLVSLNMSIEASKVKGSSAFVFLARELRKLAEYTEETLGGISMNIDVTLETMKTSGDKQLKEFSAMESTVGAMKDSLDEYSGRSAGMSAYIRDALGKLRENQGHQRDTLLGFFNLLQKIAIVREEYSHNLEYLNLLFERANKAIGDSGYRSDRCKGSDCPTRRELLELLAKYAHTDEERKFINDVYAELLGEDRAAQHGSIERGDFIQF